MLCVGYVCPGLTVNVISLCLLNRSPLMLSHDISEQRVERVRVRLAGSTWSVPFGLDQVSHVLARVSAGDSLSNHWWRFSELRNAGRVRAAVSDEP